MILLLLCWGALAAPSTERLVYAVEDGHTRTVRSLLAQGVDPDALYRRVRHSRGGFFADMARLLGGGRPYWTTPVQQGVSRALRGDPRCLELLLDAGGNPNLATPDRPPPLFRVAEAANEGEAAELVARLIERGADPQLLYRGRSVLGALAMPREEAPPAVERVVGLLVDAGAPLELGVCDGVAAGDAWLVWRLLELGAPVTARCSDEGVPLVLAVSGDDAERAQVQRAMVRSLVEAGADRGVVVAPGETVFHRAGEALLPALLEAPLDDRERAAALAAWADGQELPVGEGWTREAVSQSVALLGLPEWIDAFAGAGAQEAQQVLTERGVALPRSSPCELRRTSRPRELRALLGAPRGRRVDGIVRTWTWEDGAELTLWRHAPWRRGWLAMALDVPTRCDPDGATLRGLSRGAVHLALGPPSHSSSERDTWWESRYVVHYEDGRAVRTGWDFLTR